jgi:multidrug efflux pump subunit AcrB
MGLIRAALRRPVTVLVLVVALALISVVSLMRTRIDILPDLNLPTIYVAQPWWRAVAESAIPQPAPAGRP